MNELNTVDQKKVSDQAFFGETKPGSAREKVSVQPRPGPRRKKKRNWSRAGFLVASLILNRWRFILPFDIVKEWSSKIYPSSAPV